MTILWHQQSTSTPPGLLQARPQQRQSTHLSRRLKRQRKWLRGVIRRTRGRQLRRMRWRRSKRCPSRSSMSVSGAAAEVRGGATEIGVVTRTLDVANFEILSYVISTVQSVDVYFSESKHWSVIRNAWWPRQTSISHRVAVSSRFCVICFAVCLSVRKPYDPHRVCLPMPECDSGVCDCIELVCRACVTLLLMLQVQIFCCFQQSFQIFHGLFSFVRILLHTFLIRFLFPQFHGVRILFIHVRSVRFGDSVAATACSKWL